MGRLDLNQNGRRTNSNFLALGSVRTYSVRFKCSMNSNTKENGYSRVLYTPTKGTMFRCERRSYACASLRNLWVWCQQYPSKTYRCVMTHHPNPIAVEVDVASVGLDSNLPVPEVTSPHLRKTTSVDGRFPNVLQIRWFQPTTRRWEGWPKLKGQVPMALTR